MVGDQTGQVYQNQQGTGLGTVVGPSVAVREALKRADERRAAAGKSRADAISRMQEFKPEEVWHYYSGESSSRWEEWVENGANIMTSKGISDPWKSTDPEAIKWQIEGARLKTANANINQAQSLWQEAMKDIGTRGDQYTDEYLNKVRSFPAEYTWDEIASGDFDFPPAEFKNPAKLFSKFYNDEANALKSELGDGVVPTDDQIKKRVGVFFGDPENQAELASVRQLYRSLPAAEQNEVIAQAEILGYQDSPWLAIAHSNFASRFEYKPRDVIEDVQKYASMAEVEAVGYTFEDTKGVTKRSDKERLADEKFPDRASRAFFNRNPHLLNDESYMGQLGIDMSKPIAQRKIAAQNAFAQQIRDAKALNVSTSTTREGSGIGDEETRASYDDWRRDIGGGDRVIANQAAKFLFGSDQFAGGGEVVSANVMDVSRDALIRKVIPGDDIPNDLRIVVVNYGDEKTANRAKEKLYRTSIDGTPGGMIGAAPAEQKESYQKLLDHYQEKSTGTTVEFPVTAENEHVLKALHDEAVKRSGSRYERIGYRYKDEELDREIFGSTATGPLKKINP